MKIGILESKNFSAEATARLNRLGEVFHYTKGSVSNFIRDKEVLFVRLKYMLDEKFLGYAKALEYLCSPTTGLNHIVLRYIAKKKIDLISLNGERQFLNQIKATPEHGLGLILSLLRNYKDAYLGKQNDQWDRDRFVGEELFENKVGIIGFGRVGSILSKYVTAM